MQSPLATAGWIRSRRQQRERDSNMRGQRWIALLGTLFLHVVFLAVFVLGPPYDWQPPASAPDEFLQVRLIDADELLPPPPPEPGVVPRQLGPRRQGHAATPAAVRAASAAQAEQGASAKGAVTASAPSAPVTLPARATPPPAMTAAPQAPASMPEPAPPPTPQLQPVPLPDQPPRVAVTMPTMLPPAPPKFQPESVRPVREEGQQPVLPPTSPALPEIPATVPTPVMMPGIALRIATPRTSASPDIGIVRAEASPASPAADMQPVPLAAQLAPQVRLQPRVRVSTPTAATDLPRIRAPTLDAVESPLQAVPVPSMETIRVATPLAAFKVAVPDTAVAQSARANTRIVVAPSAAQVAETPPQSAALAAPAATSETPVAVSQDATASEPMVAASATAAQVDMSTAPNASAQGRDDAVIGAPGAKSPSAADGATAASSEQNVRPRSLQTGAGQGRIAGELAGRNQATQPGAARGQRDGTAGSYIQLKPHGDSEVMHRSAPNIGYKPTRFEGDWTPYGESSIDTALRRAVEKTTIEHTFHLPRGIRIKCVLLPLVPTSLGGCGAADPPPAPVAAKVYDRLHLAPANPVATPTPLAETTPAPLPALKLDKAAECAAARISGGPPPPDCADSAMSVVPSRAPAATSSSWVPASDQFH